MIAGQDHETEEVLPWGKPKRSYAGIWADLPDDAFDELDRIRHESTPTPPMDEQMAWLDEPEEE